MHSRSPALPHRGWGWPRPPFPAPRRCTCSLPMTPWPVGDRPVGMVFFVDEPRLLGPSQKFLLRPHKLIGFDGSGEPQVLPETSLMAISFAGCDNVGFGCNFFQHYSLVVFSDFFPEPESFLYRKNGAKT